MIYHQKNRKGEWTKKISLIVVILIVLVLFFFGKETKGIIHLANLPINFGKNFILNPANHIVQYFYSKQNMADENNILKEENKKLRLENLTLETIKNENLELKSLFNYFDTENPKTLSKILNKPSVSPFDTFVIDLGQDQISIGKKVYYQNLLIGEIEQVFSKSAVVKLYSSPDYVIPVKIGEEIYTEAKGQGAGTFVIEIPKDAEITEGDIITSAQNELIGIVNEIEINESSTFKNIYFSYPIKINLMDWVLIKNDQENNL